MSPQDPVTIAAVAALMVGVGMIATWLPAAWAARVAPGEAMRVE